MNQPELYAKHNTITKTDARQALEHYLHLIHWKCDERNEVIADIGCGDGSVTFEVLLPKLPQNFDQLYALDLSQEYLDYASKHNPDKRIVFEQFNIESDALPMKYCERFDHIFSFYCLHWVPNHKRAIENLYKMLKPGGQLLLTVVPSYALFEIYDILAKTEKWSKYMYDVQKFVPPYQYSKNFEIEMTNLFKEQGFTILACDVIPRTYTHPNVATFTKLSEAVNPFVHRIPKDQVGEHINDFLVEVRKSKDFRIESTGKASDEEKLHVKYTSMVIVVVKPRK